MTENTVLPVEFSHYNFRTAKNAPSRSKTGGAFFIFHPNGGYLSFALSFSSERSLSTKRDAPACGFYRKNGFHEGEDKIIFEKEL